MARLWEKMLWAALCGTALGFGGCKPAGKAHKAPPPPATEAPPDLTPEPSPAADAAADPDAEGVVEALDGGELAGDQDAADAQDDATTGKKKGVKVHGFKMKRVINIVPTYGPPPSVD